MIISKTWAMPNSKTFDIKPIGALISKYNTGLSVDMFARGSKLCTVTNDLDPQFNCTRNMDALEFLKSLPDHCANTILFDPPYSPRQISECYKKLDLSVNMQTTQSSFWGNIKKEITRVSARNGIVISFGWNSGGVGKSLGFKQIEIMLVAHGGWHNDTIVTVERNVK